jgi:prepilin-type N-terminal cleavage/methylation domain-containing protein
MCQQSLRTIRKRPGFTLIELLVAMTIIVFLATLAVLILPRLNEGQRAGKGADMLQGWLLIAKQRALRSGVACGLHFNDDPNNPLFMTEAYYVEQPPDFVVSWPYDPTRVRGLLIQPLPTGGASVTLENPPTGVTLTPGQYDFSGGDTTNTQAIWPVQVGDYLEIQGGGLLHQIQTISNSTTLILASAPPNPPPITQPVKTWRIIRAPRVLQGEEPLKLPNNVGVYKGVVDPLTKLVTLPGTLVGNSTGNGPAPLEILFAPSGRVLSPNVDPIYLWLADSSIDDPTRQNEPVIQ